MVAVIRTKVFAEVMREGNRKGLLSRHFYEQVYGSIWGVKLGSVMKNGALTISNWRAYSSFSCDIFPAVELHLFLKPSSQPLVP